MHVYGKHPMCITAAAKLLQSCPTLCNPRDGSPAGSPIPGILQARTLEWVAILSVFCVFFVVLCLFIIYFWSALSLCCCMWAFSSCSAWASRCCGHICFGARERVLGHAGFCSCGSWAE